MANFVYKTGFSLLHFAAASNNLAVVRALVASGAEVNRRTVKHTSAWKRSMGMVPLQFAFLFSDWDIATCLLDACANTWLLPVDLDLIEFGRLATPVSEMVNMKSGSRETTRALHVVPHTLQPPSYCSVLV